jgi:hypothetical protein
MLEDEFFRGMEISGCFNTKYIKDFSKKITEITHEVRHKGLIDKHYWRYETEEIGGTDTDIGYLKKFYDIDLIIEPYRDLIYPAQIGCSYSIKDRIDKLK